MSSVMNDRFAAIEETLVQVRAIEARQGVTRAALDELKEALIALAQRTELFPEDEFFVPEGQTARIFRLAEDADRRFALYASSGNAGKAAPPHNHTTWAVISGVRGQEHNVFYDRVDNRSVPGEGRLLKTGELTVVRGNAVAFLPDDFHTIEVVGGKPAVHLHLYGRSLEHLPERITFASPEGGAYRVYPASPYIATVSLPASTLKRYIGDGDELAILDVREEGVFSRGHLLFAASLPLSRLELDVARLVPRRNTRIVIVDGDGGALAQKAARRLFDLGWKNIATLNGGMEGWSRAGYEVFTGVNVPSKAFGEFIEHAYDTPRMEAVELKRRIDAGEAIAIFDSRPIDEYRNMSIPGATDCPGAELVYRVPDLVPSPDTLVVVNCAGRTRSIIGAQSLINAGLPNRVVALKDGTMGWHLAGFELAHGKTNIAPPPFPAGHAKARAMAAQVAARFGVKTIDRASLAALEAEADRRTLYRLDVRSPEEFTLGHLPGWRSAPGGQLVQSTDAFAPVLNARIVLADDDGVRATMTASWLIQMGRTNVYVLDDAFADQTLETGTEAVEIAGKLPEVEFVTATGLYQRLKSGGVTVVDLGTSLQYRAGRIPGAIWAVRSQLEYLLATLPPTGILVLTSPDGLLARLAAGDVAAATGRMALVLRDGTDGWKAADLPLEQGLGGLPHRPDDVWYRPYDLAAKVEDAMRDYLTWEIDLPQQIALDGDAKFRLFD